MRFQKKDLEKFQSGARKKIVEAFKKHPDYDKLFKDGLFKELLPALIENSIDSEISNKEEALKKAITDVKIISVNIRNRRFRELIPDDFDILCAGFPCQAFSSLCENISLFKLNLFSLYVNR